MVLLALLKEREREREREREIFLMVEARVISRGREAFNALC